MKKIYPSFLIMQKLPTNIRTRFSSIFSQEEMSYLSNIFSLERRPVSFRVNTLLSSPEEVSEALEWAKIEFTLLDFPTGCFVLGNQYIESDIWKIDIYKKWYIYMQSISSQSPVHFFSPNLSQFSPQGEMKPQFRILDACAAPWWKTSQLSALYPNSEIHAFEPNKIRFDKMQHNLKKLWCTNVTAIHDEIRNIWKYIDEENYFDMILIDAPCSSEGSISLHNDKFLESWDISHIKRNYKRQKFILSDTIPYLKEWWELIYSTCTIAPEENEAVVHYALCNYPELTLENIDINQNKYIKYKESLKSFEKMIFKTEISEKTLRVIPSEYSEWFYMAKFIKSSE